MNKLDSLTPLGYAGFRVRSSRSGRTPDGVPHRAARRLRRRRATAHHAELNFVPKNLAVPVPDGVALKHAAFATIGSDRSAWFPAGARCSWARAPASSVWDCSGSSWYRSSRAAGHPRRSASISSRRAASWAERQGAAGAHHPRVPTVDGDGRRSHGRLRRRLRLSSAAGGDSNSPSELAVQLARDRPALSTSARPSSTCPGTTTTMKELDVRFSRSYGPGPLRPEVRGAGVDYPIGYVRWTEQRNLGAFLDLIAHGKLQIGSHHLRRCNRSRTPSRSIRTWLQARLGGISTVFEYDVRRSCQPGRSTPTVRSAVAGTQA